MTRRIVVLESFPEPRATTNPYITQLAAALRAEPGIRLVTYSPARALFTRYDVFHVHWPENLIGGHRPLGRAARRALTSVLLARWQLLRTPVVRTWHNIERPAGLGRIDNLLLDRLDRLTTVRIRLNDSTSFPAGTRVRTIPHGHYREWYPSVGTSPKVGGRIAYVGLLRPYKGIDALVSAFGGIAAQDLSLTIAGRPVDDAIAREIRAAAERDPRIALRLSYIGDTELVAIVSAAELVALPYRSMHNSGTVLAALSLDRPVLVPRSEVTDRLAREVGEEWVLRFDGELTADVLESAVRTVHENPPTGAPDLSARDWRGTAAAHAEAFAQAIAASAKRRRASREVRSA